MGGCRCSYKQCNRSSDSKTHFFHFPAKSRARCLKWVENAGRPGLSSLTESQLRNKVVCQYHFKPHMFMNFKHDRLVHSAIPTEDDTEKAPPHDCEVLPVPPYKMCEDENPIIADPMEASTNTSINLDPNISSLTRRDSTMTINFSPVLGLSFIPPPQTKSKFSTPYVELLTRNYRNPGLSKDCIQESKEICQAPSTPVTPANNNNFDSLVTVPDQSKGVEVQEYQTDALFQTPPKKTPETVVCTDDLRKSTNRNEITRTPRKQVDNAVLIMLKNKGNEVSLQRATPQNLNVENIKETPVINKAVSITLRETEVPASGMVVSSKVGEIHKQLLEFSKQKAKPKVQISKFTIKKPSGEVITRINRQSFPKKAAPDVAPPMNDFITLIQENCKEIAELKKIVAEQKAEKIKLRRKLVPKQRFIAPRKISRAGLYARIVPYLSPKVACMVHREMFPSMVELAKSDRRKKY